MSSFVASVKSTPDFDSAEESLTHLCSTTTSTIQIPPLGLNEYLKTARCVAKAYFANDGIESTAAKRRRSISLFGA